MFGVGVFEVAAEGGEIGVEKFEGAGELGELAEDVLSVFFDLEGFESGGDGHKINVKGVGRDGDDFFLSGVGGDIDLVFGEEGFVINVFGGDVHESEFEGALGREDVFFGNSVDVNFDLAEESGAGFLTLGGILGGEQVLEIGEGEFGVDGYGAFGEEDEGVNGGAGFEFVLSLVGRVGQDVGEEIFEGPFAEVAAEFGRLEDVLEFFDVGADVLDVAGGFGELSELSFEVAEVFVGGGESFDDGFLGLLGEVLRLGELVVDVGGEILE